MSKMQSSFRNRKTGFVYFIREGFAGIFLNGFMSFAAITVIAACLLIVCTFSLVAYNIGLAVSELEGQSEIIVYIDETLTDQQARDIESEIADIENVQSVSFISKDQAFDEYLETLGEDAYVMESYREQNPLRDSYRITMADIELHAQTVAQLELLDGIAESNSSKEISDRLIQIRGVVNAVSYTLIALLGLVSIFITANTVKLAMFSRRDEIAIMRMVGATNRFIRAPFIVEGILLGMFAAVVAYLSLWGVYGYIGEQLTKGTEILTLVPFEQFSAQLMIMLLCASVVIGVFGSVFTIRKFMKT